jgi:NAD-dependent deacetylase
VVYPAAGLLAEARASGARTTVLALERPGNASAADEFVCGRAVETVPEWVRSLG